MQQVTMSQSPPVPPPPSSSREALSFSGLDRRRTIRIRRSALLEAKLGDLDRPSIKLAESMDEYIQAFKVLHDVYLVAGYLEQPSAYGIHFGVHHMLPKTCVFVFKSYLSVYATISYIPDSEKFGLPMDELYNVELDSLRREGRKVVEIGALATVSHRRWNNIMMFLSKAVFQYAMLTGADDLCIMVNPKHVRFYQSIFLFEQFGEEKYYNKVDAPAVALRANMHSIEPALYGAYHSSDFDADLHAFFVKLNSSGSDPEFGQVSVEKNFPLESEIARYLFRARPEILNSLSTDQMTCIERLYHKALYALPLSTSPETLKG